MRRVALLLILCFIIIFLLGVIGIAMLQLNKCQQRTYDIWDCWKDLFAEYCELIEELNRRFDEINRLKEQLDD